MALLPTEKVKFEVKLAVVEFADEFETIGRGTIIFNMYFELLGEEFRSVSVIDTE